MGKTAIKICGLQSTAVLESILSLPVDYIGFVFAESKRQVTPEQAKEMIDMIKTKDGIIGLNDLGHSLGVESTLTASSPQTVGVFVNPTREQLLQLLMTAPLDVVQLHGQESPEFCSWVKETLGARVFKVFSVSGSSDANAVNEQLDPYNGKVDAILLDTYDPVVGGGTGTTFAWDCIPLYQQWTNRNHIPLLIAGGLDADNVHQLVSVYAPDGVDVSSGVETNGVKDVNKITVFIERVRNHG